ncbi:unnamed protein product, partial [Brassica oleracea]
YKKAYISEGDVSSVLSLLRVLFLEISGDNSFSKIFTSREVDDILKIVCSLDPGKRLNPYGIIVGNVDVEKPSLTD